MILHTDVDGLGVTIAVAQKLHQPARANELSVDDGSLKLSAEILASAADVGESAEGKCTEPHSIMDEPQIAL
jgi:hypothetical protein